MSSACQYEYGFYDGSQAPTAYNLTAPDNFPPKYVLREQRTAELAEYAADNADSFNEPSYSYIVNDGYAMDFNGYYAAGTQRNTSCNCSQTKNRHATLYSSLSGEQPERCAARSSHKQGNVDCSYTGQSEYTVCDLSTPVDFECSNVCNQTSRAVPKYELATTTYNLHPSPVFYPDSNISYVASHENYDSLQPTLDPPPIEFTRGVLTSAPAAQCISSAYSYTPENDIAYSGHPQPEWTNGFYQPPIDYDSQFTDSRFAPNAGQSNSTLINVSRVPVTSSYDAYFVPSNTAGDTNSSAPNYQIEPVNAAETYQPQADNTYQTAYPTEFTSYAGSRIQHSDGSYSEYCPYAVEFEPGIPVTCGTTMLANNVQSYSYTYPNTTVDTGNNFCVPQDVTSGSSNRLPNQETLDLQHSFKPTRTSCQLMELNKSGRVEPSTEQENFNETSAAMQIEPSTACCPPDHNARFSCVQCHKNFARYSHLEAHLRVHTGERPFCCCICAKTFSQVANLTRHLKSHRVWPRLRNTATTQNSAGTVENVLVKPSSSISEVTKRVQIKRMSSSPLALGSSTTSSSTKSFCLIDSQYECGFCWKRFDSFLAIKSHLVRHNDEKVFQCLVASCGETFKEVGDFLEHLSIHRLSDANWLHCKQCNKQYNTIAELFEHYSNKGETHKTTCRAPATPNDGDENDDDPAELCSQAPPSVATPDPSKISRKFVLLPLSRLSSRRFSKTSRFKCPVCKIRRFARVGLLRAHLLSDHLHNRSTNACAKPGPLATLPEDVTSVYVSQGCDRPPTPSSHTAAEGPSSSAENETGTLTPTLPSHGAGHSATQVEFLVGGYRQKSAVSVTSNAASGGGRKRSFQCVICGRTFKKRKFFDDHEQLCRQKQIEQERRQRWRENRKQSSTQSNADWEHASPASFSPDNSTIASGPLPVSAAAAATSSSSPSSSAAQPSASPSLSGALRRSARSRTRKWNFQDSGGGGDNLGRSEYAHQV